MNWYAILWLVLMVVFLVAEGLSAALVSSWFAVGSLAALVASLLHAPFWLQVLLFLVVSIALLAALRPLVRRYIRPRITRTNVDAVIGATGHVSVTIDNVAATGQVKIGPMEWTARSSSGEVIPVGTVVKVDRIEGVRAYVAAVNAPVCVE